MAHEHLATERKTRRALNERLGPHLSSLGYELTSAPAGRFARDRPTATDTFVCSLNWRYIGQDPSLPVDVGVTSKAVSAALLDLCGIRDAGIAMVKVLAFVAPNPLDLGDLRFWWFDREADQDGPHGFHTACDRIVHAMRNDVDPVLKRVVDPPSYLDWHWKYTGRELRPDIAAAAHFAMDDPDTALSLSERALAGKLSRADRVANATLPHIRSAVEKIVSRLS